MGTHYTSQCEKWTRGSFQVMPMQQPLVRVRALDCIRKMDSKQNLMVPEPVRELDNLQLKWRVVAKGNFSSDANVATMSRSQESKPLLTTLWEQCAKIQAQSFLISNQ